MGKVGMSMLGKKRIGVRKRWLALASVIWMVAAYTIWFSLFAPNFAAAREQLQAGCAPLDRSFPQFYAGCLEAAESTIHGEQTAAAGAAFLAALMPVAILWIVVGGILFARECRVGPEQRTARRTSQSVRADHGL